MVLELFFIKLQSCPGLLEKDPLKSVEISQRDRITINPSESYTFWHAYPSPRSSRSGAGCALLV